MQTENHEELPHPAPGPGEAEYEHKGTQLAMNTPKAANDNRESKQISDPYMDAMIDQSWKKLSKDLGKPALTLVPKPDR
ncbi:MAG TPA: hypothetical protein VGJ00_04010 [Rhabdochlamydiaceae bacterium]|jgi:hypothetical protein